MAEPTTNEITVLTSVPPHMSRSVAGLEVGEDHQRNCIASWGALSTRVISINPEAEADRVGHMFPDLRVVSVPDTTDAALSRPLLRFNDLLEVAASHSEVIAILNADILIRDGEQVARTLAQVGPGRAVVAHRLDVVDPDSASGAVCMLGIDLIALHRSDLQRIRSTVPLYLGAPWWDYHVLGALVLQGFEIGFVASEHVIHLAHGGGWDKTLWDAIGIRFGRDLLARAGTLPTTGMRPDARRFLKVLKAFGTRVRRRQRPAWKATIREAVGIDPGRLGTDDLHLFSNLFPDLAGQLAGRHRGRTSGRPA
ncbi:MAG: hypothetical protein KDB84_01980 [Flavobacteriales bacterium]|nr:hypothetical protein [Flavobacteriales bacterium]